MKTKSRGWGRSVLALVVATPATWGLGQGFIGDAWAAAPSAAAANKPGPASLPTATAARAATPPQGLPQAARKAASPSPDATPKTGGEKPVATAPAVLATKPPQRVAPPPSVTEQDLAALRGEIAALRADLARIEGNAPAAEDDPERARIQGELAAEKKKLDSIQTAIKGGLDPAAVADSVKAAETRITELEAALAKLNEPRPASEPRSLQELAAKTQRLEQELAQLHVSGTPPTAAEGGAVPAAVPAPPSAGTQSPAPTAVAAVQPVPTSPIGELLPLELTAFGDFYYRFTHPGADDFGIGTVEIDAALRLTPYVLVSTAIAYSPDGDVFGLPAFVIDCGLFGKGEEFVRQSELISKSGVSFGRFDVPFGIAYLEYPSVANRLISTPQAVLATHGAWNDLGAQAYVLAENWSLLAYVVNGPDQPLDADTTAPALTAVGGRLSARMEGVFEVGGSAAFVDSVKPAMYLGGDVSTTLGPLDVRGEYLLKHTDVPDIVDNTHGIYARAVVNLQPAFVLARFDSVVVGGEVSDRRLSFGGAFEVFPEGEVRAVYEHSLDEDIRMLTIQIVGGSTFQPTGLRR
jgi:hypothetical protein